MKTGIIGGSGLYSVDGIQNPNWVQVNTPFGSPSDSYLHGILEGQEVYFLPRHARGHTLLPSEINYRANIFGFKALGVDRVISISAVGSLREELRPRDIVFPDQYFDRTKRYEDHTFFGRGIVAHVPFAEPICPQLKNELVQCAEKVIAKGTEYNGILVHKDGTYVNMEGPAFSTKAESYFYRQCKFDVIGMTSLTEAKLCREAEMCYTTLAMITDYDCWHEEFESVSLEMIIGNLVANTKLSQDILRHFLQSASEQRTCTCGTALKNSIVTTPDAVPLERKEALKPIIGKYMS